MIGEDAVNSTTAMLEKLMQIILEIIRMQRDSQRYNSREAAKSSKENAKQPISCGWVVKDKEKQNIKKCSMQEIKCTELRLIKISLKG